MGIGRLPGLSVRWWPWWALAFGSSGLLGEQLGYSDQIVGGGGEGEDGLGLFSPPDLHLIEPGLCLDPAEDLLDALADALAERVSGMMGRAPVDGCLANLATLTN